MTPQQRISRRRFIALGLAGVSGYATYGWLGSRRVVTVERTLSLPRWTLPNFRLALVSDLHVTTPEAAKLARAALKTAIAAKPDALVLPGDFVHNMPAGDDYAHLAYALGALKPYDGPIIGSLGNHDYNITNQQKLLATLDKNGIRLLKNDQTLAGDVTFRGLDDAIHGRPRSSATGIREVDNAITLWHEPDMVERLETKSSLVVSGHSHGGQVCLPFGIALYTPYGARKYIAGYYAEARTPLFVSRGVGVNRGIRYNCPPEVNILTLNPETDEG